MTSVYNRYFGDFNTDSFCLTRMLKNVKRGEACTVSVDCKQSHLYVICMTTLRERPSTSICEGKWAGESGREVNE
jgi:hypothetical protein